MWSFYQNMPNLHNRYKSAESKYFTEKPRIYVKTTPCHVASVKIWAHFDILKRQWTIDEISIFSNSSHLERRVGLSDTILKGTHPGAIPAWFGLIWFSGFRGEDLNVIFYQNLPNLHNRYKSAGRKISQKNSEYVLNYFLPCTCSCS
jgi:hypothetical protein